MKTENIQTCINYADTAQSLGRGNGKAVRRIVDGGIAELTAIEQRMAELAEREIWLVHLLEKARNILWVGETEPQSGVLPYLHKNFNIDDGVGDHIINIDALLGEIEAAISSKPTGVAVLKLEQLRELEWAGQVNDRGYQTCPSCHEGKDGAHCANCLIAAKIEEAS